MFYRNFFIKDNKERQFVIYSVNHIKPYYLCNIVIELYERFKIQHVVQFTSKTDLFNFLKFKDTQRHIKSNIININESMYCVRLLLLIFFLIRLPSFTFLCHS